MKTETKLHDLIILNQEHLRFPLNHDNAFQINPRECLLEIRYFEQRTHAHGYRVQAYNLVINLQNVVRRRNFVEKRHFDALMHPQRQVNLI